MNSTLNINQCLQVILLPFFFVAIGMLAKRLGKRDGDDAPRINDWAVSTSIVLMTFSKISGDLVEYEGGAACVAILYRSPINAQDWPGHPHGNILIKGKGSK